MNSLPRVSIVISFLNAERFIGETIESVFAQTFRSWELLLVDDGSTDASVGISREYVAGFPETLRYFDHEGHQNRGLTASRNVGIHHARGEFIAVLDSDDVWLPTKLEEQVNILDSHPEAAMVCGASQYWFSWTRAPGDIPKDFVRPIGVPPGKVYQPPRLLSWTLSEKAASPCPSNLLLRRKAILCIGGFEEPFTGPRGALEDHALLAKVYLNAPVFVSDKCWDKYRVHPDSYSARVREEGLNDSVRFFYLRWLAEYLTQQRVVDSRVWRSLRLKLWSYRHPRLARLLRPGLRAYRSLRGATARRSGT